LPVIEEVLTIKRFAVLGAGGAQQWVGLAAEDDRGAQVDVELQVDVLVLDLGELAGDAEAGVV